MGIKGDKLTRDSVISAELYVEKLKAIENITSKKMFGGHGIFHDGKMFSIIDSKGTCFLKIDESSKTIFVKKGSVKHFRMPYYSIPDDIFTNQKELISFVEKSIDAAK